MMTFYLLLNTYPYERATLIKRCKADNKLQAARLFAQRLNRIMERETFIDTELLPAIKQEDELTQQEKQWISAEDPQLLDL